MADTKITAIWPVWAAGALMVGMAATAMAAKLSGEEVKTLRNCMVMQSDDAVKDAGCRTVMRKENITKVDLEKMKSCESKPVAATDNPDCIEMVKKHGDLARGHGMDDPAKSK
jgi:hypothetical protein